MIEKVETALECGLNRRTSLFYLLGGQRRTIESTADHHAAVDERVGGSFGLSHVRHLEHRTWESLRRHALLFEHRDFGRTSRGHLQNEPLDSPVHGEILSNDFHSNPNR